MISGLYRCVLKVKKCLMVVQALEEKEIGDFIIRPSSKGPTHLSMTLKIHENVYTHIDIAEGGKESRDLTSFLSLGKTLTIGEESYEDLDEVQLMAFGLRFHLSSVFKFSDRKSLNILKMS